MGFWNLNYLTLITAAINLFLGLVVLRNNFNAKLNLYFFIFSLALAAWAFTNFYLLQFTSTVLILRATYATGGVALITAIPWINLLTKQKPGVALSSAYVLLGAVLFFLPFLDGQIIQSIDHTSEERFGFTSGPLFNIYSGLLLVLLFYLLYRLVIGFRVSKGREKFQLGYTLSGISIFAAVSFTFGVILPLFNINSVVAFDAQSSLIWVGLTAYAITRHGLFNIKVIATQSLIVLLLLLVLSRIFTATTVQDIIFESVVFVFTTIIGYFLARSVQGEVSRREEVERLAGEKTEAVSELEQRNKNLRALQRVSDIVLNESDIKLMTQKILDELPRQLDSCVGGFLSVVKGGNLVAFSFSTNNFSEKIFNMIDRNLENYSFPIKKEYNKLHEALVTRLNVESNQLSDFITPPIAKPVALTLQRIVGAKYMAAMPLYASGQPFGVMLFVFSAPKEQINEKNFEIAKAIADEMSLAIQRAEAFQKLKDANEYLSQLDKMKDEFISMASHELNTPLAAIEGYLSMILDEGMGKIDAQGKVYLSRAYASSKRLAELILDLLNVSRIEQGRLKMKFSQINLMDLAESVMHELQIKADAKKIYLKLAGDKKKLPMTWCDPDRVREVIVNLTGNAIKFTDKGGITIKIAKGEGETIRTSVIDTGRGIAKEDQKKLFQKFSQVKREIDEHQGTGLGLYISKNFVELHQGRLWVESEAGKGASFSFELPIVKEAPKEVEGAILEGPLSAPKIVSGSKDVPAIIAASSQEPVGKLAEKV